MMGLREEVVGFCSSLVKRRLIKVAVLPFHALTSLLQFLQQFRNHATSVSPTKHAET